MTKWDFRALPGHPSFIQAEAGMPKSHQHFLGPTRQGPEPLRSGCRLWKQVLAPVGWVLTVWDLAPEMQRESVCSSNAAYHTRTWVPTSRWDCGLALPCLAGHRPENRQPRGQARPAGRREGREEEKVSGSKLLSPLSERRQGRGKEAEFNWALPMVSTEHGEETVSKELGHHCR